MISVLIVNWNTRELLRACLASLQQINLEHEIIVVDNGSTDGSAQMVAAEFPGVKTLSVAHNPGYAEGNNRAYEIARGQWIWLLNPDTEVLLNSSTEVMFNSGTKVLFSPDIEVLFNSGTKVLLNPAPEVLGDPDSEVLGDPGTEVLGDAAQILVEFLENNPTVGAVASALIDARDGSVQRSCRTFPTPAALWAQALGLASLFPRSCRFGFYKMGWWNYRHARAVEQPMASSLMLRRAAIEDSGGLFDPDFPIFFNDVDLCWRLWRAGWQIWFEPRARVRHWGGASTKLVKPQMIAESHRSLRRFYQKHYRGKIAAPLFWATLAMSELAGRARVWRAKKRPPQE